MMDTTAQLVLAACGSAVFVVIVLALIVRWVRRDRDLGSDSARLRYETLHTVARTAPAFEDGLTVEGARRTVASLRGLLAARGVALLNAESVLAHDGVFPVGLEPERDGGGALLALVGERQHESGEAKVRVHRLRAGGREHVVAAPLVVGSTRVGTLAACQAGADASFVRAVSESAVWISALLGTSELETSRAALAEAEVRALRAQISPHFIYNSLNAIASFIHTDPERARHLVLEFADFTRYTFRRHGDFTTLSEELAAIDRYLELERARFGSRLSVRLDVAPEVLATPLPFLTLQPLVENAVRHGLERKAGGGTVTLRVRDEGDAALISVEDDGVGAEPQELLAMLAGSAEGHHVGLRNVDVRLRRFYGSSSGLTIDTAPGAGMLVMLRVPKFHPAAAASVAAATSAPKEKP